MTTRLRTQLGKTTVETEKSAPSLFFATVLWYSFFMHLTATLDVCNASRGTVYWYWMQIGPRWGGGEVVHYPSCVSQRCPDWSRQISSKEHMRSGCGPADCGSRPRRGVPGTRPSQRRTAVDLFLISGNTVCQLICTRPHSCQNNVQGTSF